MSGGQVNVPLVIRMTTGGGRQLAAQHSHSLENYYAHVPGLKVVSAATVEDARWMLAPALADPDPVVVFEHGTLYNSEGEPGNGPVDLTSAALRRNGSDVSIITYGGSLSLCLEAAEKLATDGIEADVIDLRSLRPLDVGAIVESVTRTHRAVVVDEGWRSVGIAAEVVALIQEQAFYELDAPLQRVCTLEVPLPYPRHLEQAALPSSERVIEAVHATLGRS
jgi:pyruvate dehydrogenase E1 component beta subunit